MHRFMNLYVYISNFYGKLKFNLLNWNERISSLSFWNLLRINGSDIEEKKTLKHGKLYLDRDYMHVAINIKERVSGTIYGPSLKVGPTLTFFYLFICFISCNLIKNILCKQRINHSRKLLPFISNFPCLSKFTSHCIKGK